MSMMYCNPGSFPYTIQPGDTYWELADRFNIDVEDIMDTNPNADPNNLLVGQVICIPTMSDSPVQSEQRGREPGGGPMGGPGRGREGFERGRERFGRERFERRREFRYRPYYPYYPYYPPYPPYPYYPYYPY